MKTEHEGTDFTLHCDSCGKGYTAEEVLYTCPSCGFPAGTLTLMYDFRKERIRERLETFSKERGIFRFSPFLPVSKPDLPFPPVGGTPLSPAPYARKRYGIDLFLKDDTRNPSASLKDRASIIGIAHAREIGAQTICAASTGNAASSLALLSAPFRFPVVIFVPRTIPQAKLAQILAAGARVVRVRGSYDDAYDLSMEATERWGWYSRNTGFNPYLGEGKKSVSLEIWEEFTRYGGMKNLDAVIVPVGDGCIIGAVYKGFRDLFDSGLSEKIPRIYGVQSEGCRPYVDAFEKGLDMPQPCTPRTLADSISVSMPRDPIKALRAVRNSGGKFVAVPDEEILRAISELASSCGIFAEPAGATSFAGFERLAGRGDIRAGETAVALVTGSGLKDIDSVIRGVPKDGMVESEPDLNEAERVMRMAGWR